MLSHQTLKPMIHSSGPTASISSAASGHPGMPSGLLRMTATSLQHKSFQSQPNSSQMQHNILNHHQRSSSGSTTKITPKDVKSRLALNKMKLLKLEESFSEMASMHKSNRMTLKPPRTNAAATITMSMAESAVSAVQPAATFKPVPARLKSYSSNNKTSNSGPSGSPVKKGNQTSSPSSSRSSSRNSSLSPRDRSGSMSNKMNNSSISPKIWSGSNSSSPSSSAASSPKGPQASKKKTSNNGYDPKAPLVSWHVRNNCAPKTCNGWNWEGEGKIQKV